MNLLASGFENFINGIFANWQIILFVIAAVLFLMTIAFRKFKLMVIILAVAIAGICVALIVSLAVEAINWGMPEFVAFLVKWVPTLIFTLTVLLATLIGAKRGLRKSLILLTHEICVAALCIILYAVLVKLPAVDGFMLRFVDLFFGGSGSFASALGVTAHCEGLKDVFVEWLPKVISNRDFNIMLSESKAYIYTLADLIYHVGFALILYIVFLLLDFIMYIIYHCCYSERKYRAKIQKKYSENKVDRRYSKHHVGGGAVGLVRGVAIALLSLSFMGTALYIVAGRGDGKMKDFDFGDDNYNEIYSVYRSIERYGTHGIFKVLNSISSTEDVPYYLFAADLVFSGELDDGEFGVSDNVVFREELSAYTDFARDTLDLLLKYGGDEIKPLIKGQATDSAFDVVLGVMSKKGFRAEFNDLISEFDAKTYIINFAMSFVNSAIANIDDMSFAPSVSDENRELLKIMFTKGYLSETIPDELALRQMTDGSALQIVQPYINVSKLVNKKDIRIIFNIVLDVLGQSTSTTSDVLKLVADVLPQVKEISLLSENRAEELDPVLGRLYAYAANCYLTEEGAEGVKYSDIYEENIEWVSEINGLLDVAEASLSLYNGITPSNKPVSMLVEVFDKNGAHYADNIRNFDSITEGVMNSRLLGKTLATSKIYTLIKNALGNLFNGIYIPQDIVYENTLDADGNPVRGEMYNLLNGLGAIGKNGAILPILENFNKDRDMEEFLKTLSESVKIKDAEGNTIGDYIVRSDLLRSVISAALINSGADYAYVPTVAREKDDGGNPVKFIKAEELSALFVNLSDLVDFILPVLQDGNADMKDAIAGFVEKPVFKTLLDGSTIFEGTVALHLVKALDGDGTVIIPKKLKDDLDGWVTVNGKNGEIKNLLDALDAAQIKVADIVGGEFDGDSILDRFTSDEFTDENLQTCLNSGVLHYTVSKFLTGGESDFGSFKLVVPEVARQSLEDDSLPSVVRKSEIENVLKLVKALDLSAETDLSAVLSKLVQSDIKQMLAESYILSASVVSSLVDNSDVNEMLRISEKYTAAATPEKLAKFNSSNPWKEEIVRLITSLDEIMNISASEEFVFDEDKLSDSLSSFLRDMNAPSITNWKVTRLTVSYASEIVRGSISTRLDELLEGNIDEGILYGAKSGGFYTERELKSLSDVLNVFDINVMELESDALVEKIESEILTLNEPAEGYSGTKLSVVYPSAIFSGIMSKTLDDVLLGRASEEGGGTEPAPEPAPEPVPEDSISAAAEEETEPAPEEPAENTGPLIDENILYDIKAGSARYKQSEIAALIDSVKALGIENFDELEGLDVGSLINDITDEEMDVVCASTIMRGVFTRQIRENDTLGVDHPLAYEERIRVIKTNEIKAIVNLVGKLDNVSDTYFDEVSLSKIKGNLFDEDHSVKSYLILKAVSDSIRENRNLIINRELIDRYDCVESEEVRLLILAFESIYGADAMISSLTDSGFTYPTAEQREVILRSEIALAKLTDQVRVSNNTENIYVSEGNFELFTDINDEVHGIISYAEINDAFNAIDVCTGGTNFVIPVINANTLIEYNANDLLEIMFASDIFRYRICDYVIPRLKAIDDTLQTEEEQAYTLSESEPVTKEVVSLDTVKEFIRNL